MNKRLLELLMCLDRGDLSVKFVYDQILSLKAENEIDASDANEVEHDAYADVGDSYASGLTDEISEHTSSAALEIITEANEFIKKYIGSEQCHAKKQPKGTWSIRTMVRCKNTAKYNVRGRLLCEECFKKYCKKKGFLING